MKTVLVLLPVREEHKQILERAGEGCRFVYERFKTVTEEQVQQAQIIIGCADPGQIHGSERLEWLQLHSAGADPYLVPGVLGPKTVLTNATGAYGKAVSEHAMALTLMMQKKLYLYRDNQRKNSWHDEGKVSSPSSSTVLVMGLGDIGLSYARKMKALGATVIGVKRRQAVCPEGVDELVTTEQLDEVLPRADVVASFLPGNGQTRHIFNAERFGRMKPGAIFVNCGRGGAVDSEALLKALQEGPLASAAVDVTEIEPLPADSPLWQQENLVITPHVAGWLHLPEILDRVVEISAANLRAYLHGETLRNVVDFATGYRK